MSADIIPLPSPAPRDPVPGPVIMPSPPEGEASSTPGDAVSRLLNNPYVIAGGALLAGMALTRLLSTSPMRRLARDLANEALKRANAKPAPGSEPGSESGSVAPASLLEQGLDAVRPQITEAAHQFLAAILKKKAGAASASGGATAE